MSIPTDADILALLDELDRSKCADDLESDHLEFKPWTDPKDDKRVATEYAVCFGNAGGGVLVFGISDKERRGRSRAIHGSGRADFDQWKRDIYASTKPHLTVELGEISVPEGTGRLLAVRVPKGANPPYGTSQGLYKKRVGKNCMPLDLQAEGRIQVATGAIDWTGQVAEEVAVEDLDPVEIERARNALRTVKPGSDLLRVKDRELLAGLGAVRDSRVTHTGLLLFGRADVLARACPQHSVQYVLLRSETEVARNEHLSVGLLNVLEQIERAFTGPANPEYELSVGLYRHRIPAFPIEVVREAVLNAVTHRDYLDQGRVLVRHTPRELVVTSPGGFIAGITPENILRHESVTRNPALAQAFVKLGLVEQAGVGRRRIFIPMLSYGKRMPTYESDGSRVTLRIFDGGFDERMAKLCAKWRNQGRDVDLDALLILAYLREQAFIDTLSASQLLQLPRSEVRGLLDYYSQPGRGILERRGNTAAATFHLTKTVARDLLGKAAYTQTRGINPIRYSEMVRAFVKDHGSITPRECRELLGLGDSASAKVEVSRLLRKWCASDGFLRRVGSPPKVRYFSRTEL
jgi:ATP-dependent DNA helicase RecG